VRPGFYVAPPIPRPVLAEDAEDEDDDDDDDDDS
jgi:hypothetical protein